MLPLPGPVSTAVQICSKGNWWPNVSYTILMPSKVSVCSHCDKNQTNSLCSAALHVSDTKWGRNKWLWWHEHHAILSQSPTRPHLIFQTKVNQRNKYMEGKLEVHDPNMDIYLIHTNPSQHSLVQCSAELKEGCRTQLSSLGTMIQALPCPLVLSTVSSHQPKGLLTRRQAGGQAGKRGEEGKAEEGRESEEGKRERKNICKTP